MRVFLTKFAKNIYRTFRYQPIKYAGNSSK